MDYASLLYGPIYGVLGVPAVLTLCGGEPPLALTAIDKTAGVVIGFKDADVETIRPAADVRAADLAGIDFSHLRNASLTMNGKDWTVANHAYIPAPTGEANGEIRLILEES
jgi:hypothetical protein